MARVIDRETDGSSATRMLSALLLYFLGLGLLILVFAC
jgi:hypothetical protein